MKWLKIAVVAIVSIFAFVLLMGSVLLWFGYDAGDAEKSIKDPEPVKLDAASRINARSLLIIGTINVPDGAYVSFDVQHERFGLADPQILTQPARDESFKSALVWHVEGETKVQDGKFEVPIDLTGWPGGKVEVWVGFQTIIGTDPVQPAFVTQSFGEMGEKMTGPNVRQVGTMRRAELTSWVALQ